MEVSGQLHAPVALFHEKEPPDAQWADGCGGPSAVEKRKISAPERGLNPDSSVVIWDILKFTAYFPKYKEINLRLHSVISVLRLPLEQQQSCMHNQRRPRPMNVL
jgi:hypothetical protein